MNEISSNPISKFETEKAEIRRKAIEDGTYQTAPNGQPSNLTGEQWETVRTENFKNWFGDWQNDPQNASKVVDKNGEPMVVYHGSNAEFNEFSTNYNRYTKGTFFSTKFSTASIYGNVKQFFINSINIKNAGSTLPGVYDLGDIENTPFDGLWNRGTNEIIVGRPNQIKSATENTGEFSSDNNNIYDKNKVKVIENKIENKINNDENLISLRPLSNDLNKDLLAYIMQNKSNNDRRQLTLNLDDFIRKNKDKMNNYFINSLNANLNINENINRKDFENSIEELYSVNPDLVVNILKLDMMNNGDLYQFASDKINQEVFGDFNIDNMNFANINDLIVLNNKNLVETYEDGVIPVDKDYGRLPVTDEFGVSYNQLHKKINSNVYAELHLNENINNFSDKAVIQIKREMNFENKKRRLNRLKIEEGNC